MRFQIAITAWPSRTRRSRDTQSLRSSRSCSTAPSPTRAHSREDMRPKPKLEVIPPLLRQHDPGALDAFHEDRVRRDLARFAQAPGLFDKYVERARVRFQKAGELAILGHWIEFYR